MKHVFEYNYSYMGKEEKKRFVQAVVKKNLESACWSPTVGMLSYREAQSVALRNGKWTQLICYDTGVHISSLRSPGWSLSTGNKETSTRLNRWWNWLRTSPRGGTTPLTPQPLIPHH